MEYKFDLSAEEFYERLRDKDIIRHVYDRAERILSDIQENKMQLDYSIPSDYEPYSE